MKILVIDLSSIAHQIPKTAFKLSTSSGISSGHVYSFLKKIPKLKTLASDLIIFCLDGGHKKRDQIDNTYKANRNSNTGELVKDLLPVIKNLPVITCFQEDFEADDLLFTIAHKLHEDYEIILLSKDYDLSFSLIYYPKVRHFFTIEQEIFPMSVFMRFGCRPEHLPLYKAIFGDSSDNITGLKLGRGKSKVMKVFSKDDSTLKDVIKEVPKKHYGVIKNNLKLVRPQIADDISLHVGEPNKHSITKYLKKYEIRSISSQDILKDFPDNAPLIGKVCERLRNAE